MKNKYKVITRDWKGQYSTKGIRGMILVGGEEDIETGSDGFAMVFSEKETKHTAQEIYDINEQLNSDDVDGFTYCEEEDNVVIEL